MSKTFESMNIFSHSMYQKELSELLPQELHCVTAATVMNSISDNWKKSRKKHGENRRACYLSAEFLTGRAIYNNLLCAGLLSEAKEFFEKNGLSFADFEEIEDAALGNGGLGRLAACFLDSAASMNLPLDGYGIRYKYGLFKQKIENGFQKEEPDDWSRFGDPWSVRRDEDSVIVEFAGGEKVKAVPYDIPVIGYGTDHISTLRLWQCESVEAFDFDKFSAGRHSFSLKYKNRAEDISRVLYPGDETVSGKLLRLRQEYFFSSASLKDIIRTFKNEHGENLTQLGDYTAIQLNDTHPALSIPELVRILTEEEGIYFDAALRIAQNVFGYTNHTIMQEALEKWDMKLLRAVCPKTAKIITLINRRLKQELKDMGAEKENMHIIQGSTVHMADLSAYGSGHINGVAKIHTDILKERVLKDWYDFYPEKFLNVTNGITPRSWLALANPELSFLITELLGSDLWKKDLSFLEGLKKYADDKSVMERFIKIKENNKKQLSEYVKKRSGIKINSGTVYDVQIKRLHEYKRQLLNILTVLEIYFELKEGSLSEFNPTTVIFAGKAAPGYFRAKGVIKLIGEVAELIDSDSDMKGILKVVFLPDYNVSYAEKIVAAADISQQISTAGTEASGTGNMKLALNGAVTFGTMDGANIEIVEKAGRENNYIFGADAEEIEKIYESYDPAELMEKDAKIKRCMNALIDGTLDDGGTGMFKELYDAITIGASWHRPDHYFVLHDFESCLATRLRLNGDTVDKEAFAKKCWLNMCSCGDFSSDRSVLEYATQVWKIKKI